MTSRGRHLLILLVTWLGMGVATRSVEEYSDLHAFLAGLTMLLTIIVTPIVMLAAPIIAIRGGKKLAGARPGDPKVFDIHIGRGVVDEAMALPPEPPAGTPPQYLAPPAPKEPTEGWWLDPKDPSLIRYHDGSQWTDKVGRSTAPRAGLPGHQGCSCPGPAPMASAPANHWSLGEAPT